MARPLGVRGIARSSVFDVTVTLLQPVSCWLRLAAEGGTDRRRRTGVIRIEQMRVLPQGEASVGMTDPAADLHDIKAGAHQYRNIGVAQSVKADLRQSQPAAQPHPIARDVVRGGPTAVG